MMKTNEEAQKREAAGLMSRLQAMCSRSECCVQDVQKRLNKALLLQEITQEQAAAIMERLLEDRFVDEERYARAFVADKVNLQGWGVMKIKNALRLKQLPAKAIENALEQRDTEAEQAMLEKVILRKDKQLKDTDTNVRVMKIIKHAMARGYEYSIILEALKHVGKNAENL